MKRIQKKKGFTMIEIIIVLVILAILIGAAVPSMMGFVSEARGKSHLAAARTGWTAAQAALAESPATLTSMALGTGTTTGEKFLNYMDNDASEASKFVFTTLGGELVEAVYFPGDGYRITLEKGRDAKIEKP